MKIFFSFSAFEEIPDICNLYPAHLKQKYEELLSYTMLYMNKIMLDNLIVCRYPDNIIVVRRPSNMDNNNTDVQVVAVEKMFRGDDGKGRLLVTGRAFKNLKPAHASWRREYHPLNLKLLGCYEGRYGLEQTSETWDFGNDVRGKCFPFHLNLKLPSDPLQNTPESTDEKGAMQAWVLLREMHTCNPKTLKDEDIQHVPRKAFVPSVCQCSKLNAHMFRQYHEHLDVDYFHKEVELFPHLYE
jgi:hypothetical protein